MSFRLRFAPPAPLRPRTRIQPVFLPFAGCPSRCVFCAQDTQSGTAPETLAHKLAGLEELLDAALEEWTTRGEGTRELAFYGGTFTALPLDEQLACLRLAARYKEAGLILRVRASTRPDALNSRDLWVLRQNGLDMLELGVQSFDDAVLAASRPGYSGDDAVRSCEQVRASGLALGVQLMPGLPGMDAAVFRRDMRRTLALRPETLRLYPCLVLEGTELAECWRRGDYTPWALDETIELLADAFLAAERSGITVIRMGLAPEPGLSSAVLAGPSHPALGSRVRGRALVTLVGLKCAKLGKPPTRLTLPRRLRGDFGGQQGEFLPLYTALGLPRTLVRWHDKEYCELAG